MKYGRLRSLLKLPADKEMSIASITDCFPIIRTAVNKHLQVLFDAQLVSSQKVGRETRYKLQPEPLLELQDWLAFFEQYWANKLSALIWTNPSSGTRESWLGR
ncbi:ArsR/SmtB family transcription factor [Paenibacillus donghaensis]|uniref:Transcriptional regulator n=1 Tax=Paenibacillus donghaensis TaxID=414771 RepID=A0A2Z2KHM7_9BACL|nr:helix-turn-helix transcriptional regulator [Paenibacillus donghaensis]ASA20362.1 transcriptional regulator [Paenibacillus donghaensis]